MRWVKQGLVFEVDQAADWMWTHASLPTALHVDGDVLRIYLGTRDRAGRSRPTFIDVLADDPRQVLYVHDQPVLDLGALGTFDDAGVMASWIVRDGGSLRLFYIGWSLRRSVPYHVAIGLALSEDGGRTFRRASEGPIMDRTAADPFFVTTPCVHRDSDRWRMWYSSGRGWVRVDDRPEPLYEIRYAESEDGREWHPSAAAGVEAVSNNEAIARPCVVHAAGGYEMWYCSRGSIGYRDDPKQSYRIGYAESPDGLTWQRKDEASGLGTATDGWDSVMTAYPFVYEQGGKMFMLYNGNGFGRSGIGVAVSADE